MDGCCAANTLQTTALYRTALALLAGAPFLCLCIGREKGWARTRNDDRRDAWRSFSRPLPTARPPSLPPNLLWRTLVTSSSAWSPCTWFVSRHPVIDIISVYIYWNRKGIKSFHVGFCQWAMFALVEHSHYSTEFEGSTKSMFWRKDPYSQKES